MSLRSLLTRSLTKAPESLADDSLFWEKLGKSLKADMRPTFKDLLEAGAEEGSVLVYATSGKQVEPPASGEGPSALQDLLENESEAFMNEWWDRLQESTRNQLRTAIRTNTEQGLGLSDLIDRLEPLFGEARAEKIAVTEVTRLFARGAALAYQAADVKQVMWDTANDPWVCSAICRPLEGQVFELGQHQEPPAHVRCRCFLSPVVQPKPRAPELV